MCVPIAEAFPPGEFLTEELEERQWTQTDFAEIIGRPAQLVSDLITGKREITRETADQIGAALGTSASYWLNLQNQYLLWLERENGKSADELAKVRRRARLNELAPVSLLRKRGLIFGDTLDELEQSVKQLFNLGSLDQEPDFVAAARRTNRDQPPTRTQLAWLACVRREAADVRVGVRYDRAGFEQTAQSASQIVRDPRGFANLPVSFADAGVRLVYLESFPGSKIDGAAFSLTEDSESPVIAISGRGKRLDKVLFTLLHEAAHVCLGHVSRGGLLVDQDESLAGTDELEREADALAARWALPTGLGSPPSTLSGRWIADCADANRVHPIVVVGRLQREGRLAWRSNFAHGAPNVTEQLVAWRGPVAV